jgi:hypothetical protein
MIRRSPSPWSRPPVCPSHTSRSGVHLSDALVCLRPACRHLAPTPRCPFGRGQLLLPSEEPDKRQSSPPARLARRGPHDCPPDPAVAALGLGADLGHVRPLVRVFTDRDVRLTHLPPLSHFDAHIGAPTFTASDRVLLADQIVPQIPGTPRNTSASARLSRRSTTEPSSVGPLPRRRLRRKLLTSSRLRGSSGKPTRRAS